MIETSLIHFASTITFHPIDDDEICFHLFTAEYNRNFATAPDSTASFQPGCTCHWHPAAQLRIASNAAAPKCFARRHRNPEHNGFDCPRFFGL
jgi:hypothetical protein